MDLELNKLSPLGCTVKKPVPIKVGELTSDTEFFSGCCVVDVEFSNPVEIAEICFKNNYTASICVKGRTIDDEMSNHERWRTYVKSFHLMPNPHCETGSQNYFAIGRKQPEWYQDTKINSETTLPHWEEFGIEELKCFSPPALIFDTEWMTNNAKHDTLASDSGMPNVDNVSEDLQELWALTQVVQSNQPVQTLGRFDVDGCYDINLLSYT